MTLQVLDIISRTVGLGPLPFTALDAIFELPSTGIGLAEVAYNVYNLDLVGTVSALLDLVREEEVLKSVVSVFNSLGWKITARELLDGLTFFSILSVTSVINDTFKAPFADAVAFEAVGARSGVTAVLDVDVARAASPARVNFDGSTSYGTNEIQAYAWDFGDGSQGDGATLQHTYAAPGTYTATLTVTDSQGNEDRTSRAIYVLEPELTFTPLTLLSFEFEAGASGAITGYDWDFGDGATATGRVVQYTYAAAGEYTVTLTLSLVGGGTTQVERTFWAGPYPVRVSGTLDTDHVWPSSQGPYVIDGLLTVSEDATLTVEAGAVVKLSHTTQGFTRIDVLGTLSAEGTAQDSVVFTAERDDAYGGDTNGDGSETAPAPGDWSGIWFREGSGGSLDHAVVRYGGNDGVGFSADFEDMIRVEGSSPSITNSVISHSEAYGIRAFPTEGGAAAAPLISGNRFGGNRRSGVQVSGSEATLRNNTFSGNGTGIISFTSSAVIRENLIEGNDLGMLISGDEVPDLGTASSPGRNTIRSNASYAIRNESASKVSALGNFWGTTDPASIDARLYDDDESQSAGPVVFDPFLEREPGEGGLQTLDVRLLLEGPYADGSMATALQADGLLPATQPYSAAPWNYEGDEAADLASIPDVVDWVLLELRTAPDATPTARRAALLLSDGRVVDLDGASPVAFSGLTPGAYFVVAQHRNHLAVMSSEPVSLDGSGAAYDFTAALSQAYSAGAAALVDLGGGAWGLMAGDADGDGRVAASDNVEWLGANGSPPGYLGADLDLSGRIGAPDNVEWLGANGSVTQVPQP